MAILDMDLADGIFNAEDTDNDYAPIPAGTYLLRVENTELKVSNSGRGNYIKVQFGVVGPTCQNRKLWENFNVRNENAQAEAIARKQLKSLCKSCGILDRLSDTNVLHNHTVKAVVAIEQSKNPAFPEPRNRIKRFLPPNSEITNAINTAGQANASMSSNPFATTNTQTQTIPDTNPFAIVESQPAYPAHNNADTTISTDFNPFGGQPAPTDNTTPNIFGASDNPTQNLPWLANQQ